MTPDDLDLERALRNSLARQVAVPPAAAVDRAGTAIRRGRRIQGRRTLAGVALAAVATVLASAGFVQLRPTPPGPVGFAIGGDTPETPWAPETAPASPGPEQSGWPAQDRGDPPVEVVVGSRLISGAGTRDGLASVGRVTSAQRVADGWLVIGHRAPGDDGLYLVPLSGRPRTVLAGADAVAVSPDGQHVAWRDGARLFAATLADDQLRDTVPGTITGTAGPVGFVGGAVLLERRSDDVTGYDVWWPDRAAYAPAWRDSVTGVYGALPDGRTVVGRIRTDGRSCLALLDLGQKLKPLRTACGPTLSPGDLGSVSPDGRWLLVNGSSTQGDSRYAGSEGALLVDLDTAFGNEPTVLTAGARLASAADWFGTGAVAYVDEQRRLVRLTAARLAAGHSGVDRLPISAAGSADQPVMATGPWP